MMVAHVTEVCISMQKLPIDNVTMHALYSDDVQAAQTALGGGISPPTQGTNKRSRIR